MRLPGLFKQLSFPRAVIRSPALILPGATKKQGAGSGGGLPAADQTQMEAASSIAVASTPGRQHFHPGHPKAWVRFNAAGTIAASYNIASVTDSGVGDWTVNIATDFSSANYCGVGFAGMKEALAGSPGWDQFGIDVASAAGTFNVGYFSATGGQDTPTTARADPTVDELHVSFFGDQA